MLHLAASLFANICFPEVSWANFSGLARICWLCFSLPALLTEVKLVGSAGEDDEAAASLQRSYWQALDDVENTRKVWKHQSLFQPPNSAVYRREIPSVTFQGVNF